jgi:hypothetical protein
MSDSEIQRDLASEETPISQFTVGGDLALYWGLQGNVWLVFFRSEGGMSPCCNFHTDFFPG